MRMYVASSRWKGWRELDDRIVIAYEYNLEQNGVFIITVFIRLRDESIL